MVSLANKDRRGHIEISWGCKVFDAGTVRDLEPGTPSHTNGTHMKYSGLTIQRNNP